MNSILYDVHIININDIHSIYVFLSKIVYMFYISFDYYLMIKLKFLELKVIYFLKKI